jgi:hypothetical protein
MASASSAAAQLNLKPTSGSPAAADGGGRGGIQSTEQAAAAGAAAGVEANEDMPALLKEAQVGMIWVWSLRSN